MVSSIFEKESVFSMKWLFVAIYLIYSLRFHNLRYSEIRKINHAIMNTSYCSRMGNSNDNGILGGHVEEKVEQPGKSFQLICHQICKYHFREFFW